VETRDGSTVPKALSYKDGVKYKQRRPVSAGGNDPMNKVKSSKGPKIEQAFFYTGPNKSDVGRYTYTIIVISSNNLFKISIYAYFPLIVWHFSIHALMLSAALWEGIHPVKTLMWRNCPGEQKSEEVYPQ